MPQPCDEVRRRVVEEGEIQLLLTRWLSAAATGLLLIAGGFLSLLLLGWGRALKTHSATAKTKSRSCLRRSRRGRARLYVSSSWRKSHLMASFRWSRPMGMWR